MWIDDVRPAPEGYIWCKSVHVAQSQILGTEYKNRKCNFKARHAIALDERDRLKKEAEYYEIELIDIDHDAGDYASDGGDYIRLLDWLEETGRNYPIRIHSQNPVGVANMRRIIERNGWKEIK